MRTRYLQPSAYAAFALLCFVAPELAFAQAGPFGSGTAQLPQQIQTILGPITPVAIMATGVLSAIGRIAWGWFFGAVIFTVCVFGAPQIVAWIRSIFSV
jgi:type IV secretory pathway VirB2 component (pilin)